MTKSYFGGYTFEHLDSHNEEDFEWEEIHSCCGYFGEPDDIIEEILSEYGEEAA